VTIEVGDPAQRAPSPSAFALRATADRQGGGARTLGVCGVNLTLDLSGALYWPDEGVLAVADLHLEKGSSFAARGMLLPPYDTAATLGALGRVIARYRPRLVIALGDSFHDTGGPARLAADDRAELLGLQRGQRYRRRLCAQRRARSPHLPSRADLRGG
jgi:hypothetical protein